MSGYQRNEPFVPTLEDPGPVTFTPDGKSWALTRDEFVADEEGRTLVQIFITRIAKAGDALPPQITRARPGFERKLASLFDVAPKPVPGHPSIPRLRPLPSPPEVNGTWLVYPAAALYGLLVLAMLLFALWLWISVVLHTV